MRDRIGQLHMGELDIADARARLVAYRTEGTLPDDVGRMLWGDLD